MDSLINFGSAIKAKEDGKIGGYLVKFSDADNPDLDGDYFTKDTDFGFTGKTTTAIYFNHRLPLKTATGKTVQIKQKIGEATLSIDDEGVLVEDAVLYNRERYEKMLDKLGWSSGTAPHLVETQKVKGANQILTWPLGLDASITPIPAQPFKTQVTSLKSIADLAIDDFDDDAQPLPDKPAGLAAKLNQHIADLVDDGRTRERIIGQMAREAGIEVKAVDAMLANDAKPTDANLKAFARVLNISFDVLKSATRRDHLQTIKGMFEEALAEHTQSRWELESTYSRVIGRLARAASAAQMAGVEFDLEAKVREATDEYTALLQSHALAQIASWMEEGGDDEFYLKAIIEPSKDILSGIPIDLSDHSELLVNGLKSVLARFRGNHEQRVKTGRVLSEKNRQRIADLLAQMKSIAADFQALLDESQPMASDAVKRKAVSETLRRQWRAKQLGVTANG